MDTMVGEMVTYLGVCEPDAKTDLCVKICDVARRFAPSVRWRVDTLMAAFSVGGTHVQDDMVSSLVGLVSASPALQVCAGGGGIGGVAARGFHARSCTAVRGAQALQGARKVLAGAAAGVRCVVVRASARASACA